ncbi:MAG: hypothetical protein Q7T83_07615 [Thermodesulfovibrionales bacterium]|nr:hypothetical protein [Thermodesulfovibrionales bacterium]MDP3110981.1 hypothetical protein [Thermodesulfovibrionales bacterium]
MAEDKDNEEIQALRNEIKRLRLEKELFQIWNRTFIINARDSITNNTGKALSWYFRAGRKTPCPLNA